MEAAGLASQALPHRERHIGGCTGRVTRSWYIRLIVSCCEAADDFEKYDEFWLRFGGRFVRMSDAVPRVKIPEKTRESNATDGSATGSEKRG